MNEYLVGNWVDINGMFFNVRFDFETYKEAEEYRNDNPKEEYSIEKFSELNSNEIW